MSKELIEELRNAGYVAHADLIEQLQREVQRQKDCIHALTEQCAALSVEKNSLLMDHGGALCDKAKTEFLEALLAGDGALITGLKNDLAAAQAREAKLRMALQELLYACWCDDIYQNCGVMDDAREALAQTEVKRD